MSPTRAAMAPVDFHKPASPSLPNNSSERNASEAIPLPGKAPKARNAPSDGQFSVVIRKPKRRARRRAYNAFARLNTTRLEETDRQIALDIQGAPLPRKRAASRRLRADTTSNHPLRKAASRITAVKPAQHCCSCDLDGYSLQTLAGQVGINVSANGHAAPPHVEHPHQAIMVMNSALRQTSKTDATLLEYASACCMSWEPTPVTQQLLQDHLLIAQMLVWAANSPPASTKKRSHKSGTCGIGVHWWNEARTSIGVENIQLYTAFRFSSVRTLWRKWVPVVAEVWAGIRAFPQLAPIVEAITSDCDAITMSGDIERLHSNIPFTSGYMADAGERGTSRHFDQSTVGDSWVLIFSAIGSATTGGGFWVLDPVTQKAVSLGSTHGPRVVLCRAGLFEHGATSCSGGARIVSVLWNSPRIRDDRRRDPRPLLVEAGSKSWKPGGPVGSYAKTQIKTGLQSKALFRQELKDWLKSQPPQAAATLK